MVEIFEFSLSNWEKDIVSLYYLIKGAYRTLTVIGR